MERGESPWWIRAWEESGGAAGDMPPEAATADILPSCTSVAVVSAHSQPVQLLEASG